MEVFHPILVLVCVGGGGGGGNGLGHNLLVQLSTLYNSKMEKFHFFLIFWPFPRTKYPI